VSRPRSLGVHAAIEAALLVAQGVTLRELAARHGCVPRTIVRALDHEIRIDDVAAAAAGKTRQWLRRRCGASATPRRIAGIVRGDL